MEIASSLFLTEWQIMWRHFKQDLPMGRGAGLTRGRMRELQDTQR